MTTHEGVSAQQNSASVRLENVSKTFPDGTEAVRGVNLHIEAGEFLTLLGPSGSGKTTTLNIIAGFLSASQGDVLLDETSIAQIPPHKRNLGMVFQQYALFPHMTALENISFPLRRRRVPRQLARQQAGAALERVSLSDFADRYPAQLSGGRQQRVALARAIVYSPPVLLMDEPFGALDRKLRESLQLEVRQMHKEIGTTFIFVTHDQEEALTLSDRIAVFNGGLIEQLGTPQDICEHPSSEFAAAFIGESNLLHGVIAGEGSRLERGSGLAPCMLQENHALGDGDLAVFVLRPEATRVTRLDDVDSDARASHRVNGVTRHSLFLGFSYRIEVEGDDGMTYISRVVPEAGYRLPTDGDRVIVSWSGSDGLVLRADLE